MTTLCEDYREISTVIEAVEAAEQVAALLEAMYFYKFISVGDDRVCKTCDRYDMGLYTRTAIHRMFPYRIEYSDELIHPMVHINCRCMLILWEVKETPKK